MFCIKRGDCSAIHSLVTFVVMDLAHVVHPIHRPYALLFERVLIKRAQEVAASFVNTTEQAAYVALAPTIRLPYWDWANPYNDK